MAFIPSPFKPTNRKYPLITGFANRFTLKELCFRIYRTKKTLGLETDIGSCLASASPIFGFDTVPSMVEIEKYGNYIVFSGQKNMINLVV